LATPLATLSGQAYPTLIILDGQPQDAGHVVEPGGGGGDGIDPDTARPQAIREERPTFPIAVVTRNIADSIIERPALRVLLGIYAAPVLASTDAVAL